MTPILGNGKAEIVQQFEETNDLLSLINFPNEEIKSSVYRLLLMLSSMYFEELDSIRKKIQRDIMGKVDCVTEACNESFDRGFEQGMNDSKIEFARKMLSDGKYSLEEISNLTELTLSRVEELKNEL